MALKLPQETGTGHFAEYWRVVGVMLHRSNDTARVEVNLYKDSGAREEGKGAVRTQWFDLSGVTLAALRSADNPIELAYGGLKALREFAGAEDV